MRRLFSNAAAVCAFAALAVLPVGAYSVGSQGPDVTFLQKQLVNRGYKIGVDAIFGTDTRRAVERFQADKVRADRGWVVGKTYTL